jgi:hypothetical protein
MQEALPFFKGLGKAAGDVVDGLMKLTNWITGKLNLLNGDNTLKRLLVSITALRQHLHSQEVILWLTLTEPASLNQTAHMSRTCSIHSMIGGTGQATLKT